MSRVAKLGIGAAVLFVMGIVVGQAQARPNYCKAFIEQYTNVQEAKEAKCAICHPGKEKKDRNIYGQGLAKFLGGEKITEEPKVKEAFQKTEGEKSAVEGKTFGDLLKAGKLPASK